MHFASLDVCATEEIGRRHVCKFKLTQVPNIFALKFEVEEKWLMSLKKQDIIYHQLNVGPTNSNYRQIWRLSKNIVYLWCPITKKYKTTAAMITEDKVFHFIQENF